jgi:Zn-dependent peptidase ImmA (M78 family)
VRQARRVQKTVAWLRAQDGPSGVTLPSIQTDADPEAAGAATRRLLAVPVDEQVAWASEYSALTAWREAVEGLGVLVFQIDAGEEHVRGFSAWDQWAPLIALNTSGQQPRPRVFTLMHELGHLMSRTESACFDWVAPATAGGQHEERWCERFAAAVLLPRDAVTQELHALGVRSGEADLDVVGRLRRRFHVSARAVALRLIDLGWADASLYAAVTVAFRPKPRAEGAGGGPRTPRAEKRVREYGPRTLSTLLGAAESGALPLRDAAAVLRLEYEDVQRLTELLDGRPGS